MIDQVGDDAGVEGVALWVVVAVAGEDLGHVLGHPHYRGVDGPAAQLVDQDGLALGVVHLVGQGGGGFVDDAHHLDPGQFTSVAGCLALGVGKIGWDRDYGLGDRLAQVALRGVLEAREDQGRDLPGGCRTGAPW